MSDGLPEYEFHSGALIELEDQVEHGKRLLEELACRLAAIAPLKGRAGNDIVEAEHVRQAAAFLFQPISSVARTVYPGNPVFISFSHEDEAWVGELAEKLDGADLACFKFNRDIEPATSWADASIDAIRGCKTFLSVVTPRFLKSHWFLIEAGAALAAKKPILLVLRYVKPAEVPSPFDRFQAMVVENSRELNALIDVLRRRCNPPPPSP